MKVPQIHKACSKRVLEWWFLSKNGTKKELSWRGRRLKHPFSL